MSNRVRWYARCCNTPIGNTLANPKWAFIGLIHSCLEHPSLDRDFGAAVAQVNTESALSEPKPKQRGAFSTIATFVLMVIPERVLGRYKASPFFTASGAPVAAPTVLVPSEVQQLKSSV